MISRRRKRTMLKASNEALSILRKHAPSSPAMVTAEQLRDRIALMDTPTLADSARVQVKSLVLMCRYLRIIVPCMWRAYTIWHTEPSDDFIAAHYPLEWNRAQAVMREMEAL